MNFQEYDLRAEAVAIYPGQGTLAGLTYAALGMGGETGEFQDKLKRVFRDDGGVLTSDRIAALRLECGDVLWYVAAAARELGCTLEQIAEMNLAKLESRKDRGVVQGQGDNR